MVASSACPLTPPPGMSLVPSLQGGTFGKLAVLTKDTKALAEKVSGSGGAKKVGGGDVLFAGEVPGIGTKVKNGSRPPFSPRL